MVTKMFIVYLNYFVVAVTADDFTTLVCSGNWCYILSSDLLTWTTAFQKCEDNGAQMLSLAEDDFNVWKQYVTSSFDIIWIAKSDSITAGLCPYYSMQGSLSQVSGCSGTFHVVCKVHSQSGGDVSANAGSTNAELLTSAMSSAETIQNRPFRELQSTSPSFRDSDVTETNTENTVETNDSVVTARTTNDPLDGSGSVSGARVTSDYEYDTEWTTESADLASTTRSGARTDAGNQQGRPTEVTRSTRTNAFGELSSVRDVPSRSSPDVGVTDNNIANRLETTDTVGAAQNDIYQLGVNANGLLLCPSLPNFVNAAVIDYNTRLHSVVTIDSRVGHKFTEGGSVRTVICLGSGRWNSLVAGCKALTCRGENRGMVRTDGSQPPEEINVGCKTSLQCKDNDAVFPHGEKVLNSACVQIKDASRWSREPGSCKARCPPVPLLRNATVFSDYVTDMGAQVKFKCKEGHRFSDGTTTKVMVCQQKRTWTDIGDCHEELCPQIITDPLMTVNTTKVSYGTRVMATCAIGYHFKNGPRSVITECTADLTWSNNLTECVRVECRQPNMPVNAAVISLYGNDENLPYNATIRVTCHNGFRFDDGYVSKTIRCTEEEKWNETISSCEKSRCEPVPSVLHASPNTILTDEGTLVSYTCVPGYNYDKESGYVMIEARCIKGEWRTNDIRCTIISCASLEQPNASLNTTERVYGTTVEVSCDAGYRLDEITGSSEGIVTCNEKGEWDSDKTLCKPVDCGVPRSVRHAVVTISTNTTYKGVIHYNCLDGYWFSKDVFRVSSTCSWNGEWLPLPDPCIPVKCLPLSLWDGIIADTEDSDYGVTVSYTCDNNRTFVDGTVLKITQCMSDGNWSPDVVGCPAQKTISEPKPTESKHSSQIGYISIGVIVCGAVAIVLLDSKTFYVHLKMMKQHLSMYTNPAASIKKPFVRRN